ncbi:Putative glycoside/cation symporter YagG [Alphaproteobacteria bacterium SO-S41]|nr:Putative glycoside/cation symporter YagG [Alphaproteobacteria bacterium SO-S41]
MVDSSSQAGPQCAQSNWMQGRLSMTGFTLSGRTIAAYVLPTAPLAALGLPLVVYVAPFYVSGLGLDQAQVGLVLIVARLLDLLIDPIIGWASDTTRTRWGRRRPWLTAAVPFFVIGVFLLFMPPAGATIGWFAAWIILSYLAYSVATISHIAWGAELSGHYHERSRVQGWREFAGIAGFLLVLALPVLLEIFDPHATIVDKVSLMGWFVCISMPITVLVTLLYVPEPPMPSTAHKLDVGAAVKLIAGNKALRKLLLADLLQGLAPGITGSLFIFMIAYYFQLPKAFSIVLFIYFVAGLLFVPMWIKLSYKISKHRTLCAALLYTSALMPILLFLPKGEFWIIMPAFILFGVGYGAGGFLLRSIMADVIDIDTLATGSERSGLFYSLLVMTNKLGYAAAGLAYPVLSIVGFDGRPGAVNSPEAINGLGLTFVFLPLLFMLLTVWSMWNFPIDEFKQREVREAIARKREAAAAEIAAMKID